MNRLTFTALTGSITAMLATQSLAADVQTPIAKQRVAMLIYPGMTTQDFIAPQLVFAAMGADVKIVWKDKNPIVSDSGVPIVPTQTFDETQAGLTILFVPGGSDSHKLMNDGDVLAFLQRVGPNAKYVTSVCTGALILAAAGLLTGYRATTHWVTHEILATLGAIPVSQRVVVDRNRITGAGVTAGLDFGLTVAATLRSEKTARSIQLAIEYDPQPPFDSGSPAKAGEQITSIVRAGYGELVAANVAAAETARKRVRV